ncbi:hypothetical protein XENOCAPTIV_026979 [Xenoophorus captivus]|uniref:Uncharacterized protein n=1 Tax=Xenoophorus captivus TaxID=1517983 RepID=A0ABV0RVD9_9TELE
MLPSRHPGHRDWHVKLLPTHVSKASVWRLYMKSAKELELLFNLIPVFNCLLCACINSFDAKRPGVVLARTHSNTEPVSFQLLCDPEVLPPVVCVPALPAPGLATDRHIYLYSKIKPFCSDEAKDIT